MEATAGKEASDHLRTLVKGQVARGLSGTGAEWPCSLFSVLFFLSFLFCRFFLSFVFRLLTSIVLAYSDAWLFFDFATTVHKQFQIHRMVV